MDRLTWYENVGKERGVRHLRPGVKRMEANARLAAYEDTGRSPEWCAEMAKAEAEGRLHIAPVEDGTEIWFIADEGTMFFDDSVDYDNGKQLLSETYVHGYTEFCHGELGKDWYLTREAAEAALVAKPPDKYEVEMIPTDDYGLFKNGELVKAFCSRREADEALAALKEREVP